MAQGRIDVAALRHINSAQVESCSPFRWSEKARQWELVMRRTERTPFLVQVLERV